MTRSAPPSRAFSNRGFTRHSPQSHLHTTATTSTPTPLLPPDSRTTLTNESLIQATSTETPLEMVTRLQAAYPALLADNTWWGYLRIARRLDSHWKSMTSSPAQSKYPDQWNQQFLADWVLSTGARIQGQLSYHKVISALIALRHKAASDILALARKSLLGQGATKPIHQAPAMPRTFLDSPILAQLRLPVMLAWKCAARWDEIQRLKAASCQIIEESTTPTEHWPLQILVDWDRNAKASRTQPFRASRYTLIEGNLTEEIAHLLRSLKNQEAPITTMTTTQLDRLLRNTPYTAHSFKAGALDLVTATLEPSIENEARLSRLAKHRHALDPTVTTLAYIRSPIGLARMLGTHLLTRLL